MNNHAILVGVVVCGCCTAPTLGQTLAIDWFTIDGGSATASTGGSLEARGTIGQPDAGIMSGGGFELVGGFQAAAEPACYADCDSNAVLDIFDFLCFQNSFVAGEPYACECNPDPVCDIFDFLCFQTAFVAGCP